MSVLTLSDVEIAALAARVAVGLGGRSTLSRVTDETIVSAGRAFAAARKAAVRSVGIDRDDTVHADFLAARDEFFGSLTALHAAYAVRHVGDLVAGRQAFRDALAVFAVKSRVPVPARAMSTRVSSAILNYARKHWFGFNTATPLGWDSGFDPQLGVMGMARVSDHFGVWETPEDAVQAAVLHLIETGHANASGIPIGQIFRAVKFAAMRMSRGHRAYDHDWTHKGDVAAYDWTRDGDVATHYDTAEEWRTAIAAWATHKGYADKLAQRDAEIKRHREALASLMSDATDALYRLLSAGLNAYQVAKISGYVRNDGTVGPEQIETMIRHAAKSSSFDSTFLPAIPEWDVWEDDEPAESVNDVVVRRAEGMRAIQVRHVNR